MTAEVKVNDVVIHCSYDALIDYEDFIPHELNTNDHPDNQVELLAKLIKKNGVRLPVIISNFSKKCVAGHGRFLAFRKLGMDKIPVSYQNFNGPVEEYRFLESDNHIARYAEFNESKMLDNLKTLDIDAADLDFEEFGLIDFELPQIEVLEPGCDEDTVSELKEDPITKRGDIWLLGSHKIMCGDSTMIDDVEKLMKGEKADMVFTDPPYGMKLDADYSKMGKNGKKWENVKGDHDDFSDDFINNIFGVFSYVEEVFLWGADYYCHLIPDRNEGNFICWDKTLKINGNGDKSSEFELCWSKKKHSREVIHFNWFRYFGLSSQDNKKRLHPTQKPLEVITPFLNKYSDNQGLIVDLFLGSGSTLIACEKTNRKCCGMELDEKYCDVIIKRWQEYTKKEATLESTGETYNLMVK